MPELKDRLRADLTAAMKTRDGVRASTLRMALTAVLVSEAKKRREAAEAFDAGGRDDSASMERAEAAVLAEYLPSPLTDDEMVVLVTAAVDELGVRGQGMQAMGRAMGQLKPQVTGRADGAAVAAEVRRQLTG